MVSNSQTRGVKNDKGFQEVNLHAPSSPPPSPPQLPPPPPPEKTSFATIKKISKTARKCQSFYQPSQKDLALPTKVVKEDHSILRRTKSFMTKKHKSCKDASSPKEIETCVKPLPTLVSKQTQTYVDIRYDDKILFPSNHVLSQHHDYGYVAPENVYNSLTTRADVHR